MIRHALIPCKLGMLAAACSSASLALQQEEPGAYARQKVVAEFCAPAPVEEEVPYKILFVIDTSFSNSWTDPTGRRKQAIQEAINAQLDNTNVSFAVIAFSDEPGPQTFGFTRDLRALDGALEHITAAQGGTNYTGTLWEMNDFIDADADALEADERARTHYVVFWVSDGLPSVGASDPASLVPGVSYLRNRIGRQVAEVTLNTAFYTGGQQTSEEEAQQARTLLEEMAREGGGAFTDIGAEEPIQFVIDPAPEVREFSFESALACNYHARVGDAAPNPDSDGDGVPDHVEDALGLDAANPDGDGDGFRDAVELLLPKELSPTESDSGCPEPGVDTDGDGLWDCEEQRLGTLVDDPDTDHDRVIDGVEVLLGSSPLDSDPALDLDLDGITDLTEVAWHLAPRNWDPPARAASWAYAYHVEPTGTSEWGTACYRLRVENLWMAATLPTQTHARGKNELDLIVVFKAGTDARGRRFFRARMRGTYLDQETYQPASGRFALVPADFAELAQTPAAVVE